MKQDDYLPNEAYEDQPVHPLKTGFTGFFDEESENYFFAMVDEDGKVLLKSEGYASESGRDGGIDSVISNREKRKSYSVRSDEESGRYYLSLRAGNNQEIARSVGFATEAEALALLDDLAGRETLEIPAAKTVEEFDPIGEREAIESGAVEDSLEEVSPTERETEVLEGFVNEETEVLEGLEIEEDVEIKEKPASVETARRFARFAPEGNGNVLISLKNLKVHFNLGGGGLLDRLTGGSPEPRIVKAVDGVSFDIEEGETLGLVGESGCGKSTLGKAILRLTPITDGKVLYKGKDLAHSSDYEMREQRKNLQMIFQDPYASLNPRMTVGNIIGEPIRTYGLARGRSVRDIVEDLMETVGMSRRFIKRYPHEFSGGQRQRIGIARALAVDPEFIVADEPISALDVSIQAQIMNLMDHLQAEKKLTYLFISHDLRAVRHVADRVAVMYLGKIVELAEGKDIYEEPLHPYSKALISAVPVPDPEIEAQRKRIILTGDVPSPINPPSGCRFHTRCPYMIDDCKRIEPELVQIKPRHFAACIRISPEKPDIEKNVKEADPER